MGKVTLIHKVKSNLLTDIIHIVSKEDSIKSLRDILVKQETNPLLDEVVLVYHILFFVGYSNHSINDAVPFIRYVLHT